MKTELKNSEITLNAQYFFCNLKIAIDVNIWYKFFHKKLQRNRFMSSEMFTKYEMLNMLKKTKIRTQVRINLT